MSRRRSTTTPAGEEPSVDTTVGAENQTSRHSMSAERLKLVEGIAQFLVIFVTGAWMIVALLRTDSADLQLTSIVFFALTVTAVDVIPVNAWAGMQLSLSFPILIAVAITFTPPVAGLIALLGSIDPRELRGEVGLVNALSNRFQVALSVILGSAVFYLLRPDEGPWYWDFPAAMAATLVAYATNATVVAIVVSLRERTSVVKVIERMHGARPWEFLVSYLGLGLFGVVIAQFYELEGAWPVVAFLAPLVFARQMYFRSRALADQLAERNELLQEQAERLEQLLQKEVETVDELRELNRMKGEFVAVVSHELRTPVTALIGYAKTLQQGEFAEDAMLRQEFLERMERQGDRLLRLVENLLTASRLESRELPLSIQRVLFEDVSREVVEGLSGEASRVIVDVPTDLPVLHTDRQLLSRVVSNLIDNALKYSPDGTPCELGARADGDGVMFWVRDHGIGIPAEKVDRIFDRFYQVDSSSTRTFRGAGLGLSLVADLLKHLGGKIDVDSIPDQGSTFTVRIPRQHPMATEEDTSTDSSAVG